VKGHGNVESERHIISSAHNEKEHDQCEILSETQKQVIQTDQTQRNIFNTLLVIQVLLTPTYLKGTANFFVPNLRVVINPSMEIITNCEKFTRFPQPGSSLTSYNNLTV